MKIFYSTAEGDVFAGTGDGNDWVSYSTATSINTVGVTIDLRLTTAQNTVRSGLDTLSGIDNIIGSDYNDNLMGNANNNFILGGQGNDIISGYQGDDTLDGGSGNDQLYGDIGSDALYGNIGADKLDGGAGNDLLDGGVNHDQLYGDMGNDMLYGSNGDDTLDGGSGDDAMSGGRDNDIYVVDSINDSITEAIGFGNKDTVLSSVSWTLGDNLENLTLTGSEVIDGTGNTLNNTIKGNAIANILDGGSGNDTLAAGGGDDKLIGSAGTDRLTGGLGSDTFVFNSASDTGGSTRDIIIDFNRGSADKIDLHGIFGGTATFLGTGGFTGAAPELNYSLSGKDIIVSGDINHDASADFSIQVNGMKFVVASDFIF